MAAGKGRFTQVKNPVLVDAKHIIGLGADGSPRRIAQGAGIGDAQVAAIVEEIRNRKSCGLMTMPTIEEVGWVLDGPQSDASIQESFGAEIDPLHSSKSPVIDGSVETTLAMPGETQTFMIVCAVGWHLEPEPVRFVASGNAWEPTNQAAAQQPISPDAFTLNDLVVATGFTPVGTVPGETFVPAYLDWGGWAEYAAWCMVRGFNLRWQIGQNTNLMFDSLRNTAYMPDNAQDGSASSSLVNVAEYVRRVNDYYQRLSPGAPLFLKQNALRIGSVGTAPNVGAFHPSRDGEFVEATFGGIGLRKLLKDNSEFRPLATPYLLGAGIPIGLKAEVSNEAMATQMRLALSITSNASQSDLGIPPEWTDAATILGTGTKAGTAGVTAVERTLDGSNVSQQYPSLRAGYKGGRLLIKVKIKGFPVTEDLYNAMTNNSQLRDAICSSCGIRMASLNASGAVGF